MGAMKRISCGPAPLGWWGGTLGGGVIIASVLGVMLGRAADGNPNMSPGVQMAANESADQGAADEKSKKTATAKPAPKPKPEMSPGAKQVANDRGAFGPDPHYGNTYEPTQQIEIYGGKHTVNEQRPLVEIGQPLYVEGPLSANFNDAGAKNLVTPAFSVFGDWRTAFAYNNNGPGKEFGQIATRLNLETDLQLTATERIHALFRPLDQNGEFTHVDVVGPNQAPGSIPFNATPRTLFFEGDLGNITAGLTDKYQSFDLPFAVGLVPLLFQNGVWVNSAMTGGAASITGRNSPVFHISNMDVTFFSGFDEVTTPAIKKPDGSLEDHGLSVFGMADFVEANDGYWESGIGWIQDDRGLPFNQSYGDATIAFTKRYFGWLSNSMRVVYAFGQDAQANGQHTADGVIFLLENSLISPQELVLVPYFNAFAGFGHPQSLMRNADAGGILFNTGITFETDGLTGFPKLDDSGQDTYGGAVGVEYLFNLDQQIVLEASTVQVRTSDVELGRQAKGAEYGVGARYQRNLTNSLLFRADVIYADEVNQHSIAGIRAELRQKF